MRKTILFVVLSCSIALAAQTPAQAGARNYIASFGDDNANCDRPTPCATIQGALNKSTSGAEIICLDTISDPSAPTITQSITIDCSGAYLTTNTIQVSAAATDVVTLRGIAVDAASAYGWNQGTAAIVFTGAGTLRLEKTTIGYPINIFHASGVAFAPNGTAKLQVVDCFIAHAGIGNSTPAAGIYIRPASGIQATVAVERTVVENNLFGIFADGTAGGTIRGAVKDSFVSGNVDNGISVNTTGANVSLMIENTLVSGNNYGLVVAGTGGLLLVRHSTITANNNGLATFSGGQAVSYRDNAVNNNTVDGAFSFAINTQ
jgi:hypothetical protein